MARYYVLALLMVPLAFLPSLATPGETTRQGIGPIPKGYEEKYRPPNISLPAPEPVSEADAREIDRLIRQLSSSSFAEREAATRGLEKTGNAAVKALRTATSKGADLELRRRAEQLIDVILTKDLPQRFGESLATVEKMLPRGWSVMRTISGSTPPDWWTDAPKAGFFVEARNDEEVLQ
ncbi:MAG TPA: hypothetical protein VH682_05300, partial [Gemmataceae bacterium]